MSHVTWAFMEQRFEPTTKVNWNLWVSLMDFLEPDSSVMLNRLSWNSGRNRQVQPNENIFGLMLERVVRATKLSSYAMFDRKHLPLPPRPISRWRFKFDPVMLERSVNSYVISHAQYYPEKSWGLPIIAICCYVSSYQSKCVDGFGNLTVSFTSSYHLT